MWLWWSLQRRPALRPIFSVVRFVGRISNGNTRTFKCFYEPLSKTMNAKPSTQKPRILNPPGKTIDPKPSTNSLQSAFGPHFFSKEVVGKRATSKIRSACNRSAKKKEGSSPRGKRGAKKAQKAGKTRGDQRCIARRHWFLSQTQVQISVLWELLGITSRRGNPARTVPTQTYHQEQGGGFGCVVCGLSLSRSLRRQKAEAETETVADPRPRTTDQWRSPLAATAAQSLAPASTVSPAHSPAEHPRAANSNATPTTTTSSHQRRQADRT